MVDAWEAAYRRHAVELTRYATVMVGVHDAADVVSDAMANVFGRPESRSEVENVRALLFRAVHHRVIDLGRASSRRRRREETFALRSLPAAALDGVTGVDARAALRVLSVQQRSVVFLAYWADQTPAEISVVLGVSEGTVRKQLARARARLREVLDG